MVLAEMSAMAVGRGRGRGRGTGEVKRVSSGWGCGGSGCVVAGGETSFPCGLAENLRSQRRGAGAGAGGGGGRGELRRGAARGFVFCVRRWTAQRLGEDWLWAKEGGERGTERGRTGGWLASSRGPSRFGGKPPRERRVVGVLNCLGP